MKVAKYKGGIRAARYQVGDVEGERIETMNRWREISDGCMVAANALFQSWLIWNVKHKTADKVRKYQAEWIAFQEGKGEKPKSLFPFPPECSKYCYDVVVGTVKNVNMSVLMQLIQSEKQRFMMRPATHGKWPYWHQVLLCREKFPQFTHMLPIPVKRSAYDLIPPLNGSKTRDYTVVSRLNRVEPTNGSKRGTSCVDRFTMFARKKNIAHYRAILGRIDSGEYQRKGGSLAFDERKKRWFYSIMYQLPKKASDLDMKLSAILRPAEDHPWELDLGGKKPLWIGGDGLHVISTRRNLNTQRKSRQGNYRNAGSANKGHGRKRALNPLHNLSFRWKDFVRTANDHTTTKVIQILLDRRIGNIEYEQPTEKLRDQCFLAGNINKCAMSWDWFQVGKMLQQKAEIYGIKVKITKKKPPPEDEETKGDLVEK